MISPKKAQQALMHCATTGNCVLCPIHKNCKKGMLDIAKLIQHMDNLIKKHKEETPIGKTSHHQA